jgi:multicomponent K+:H+ antiporter subunit E
MVISILANVISMTPGTVSTEITEDKKTLIVHGSMCRMNRLRSQRSKPVMKPPFKEIFTC